ncbi:hypothetical protein H1S01_12535 [Heliobacterium chlorum]|uniref:Uncharacterized protein n=1 Tax=Heliobacterium chlorum TaxID=2698 RepID=A0ABR7T6M1_HELCL|nr:hypothetical protein [Heliobacterium chlorum]MBC9785336.1 hypothetical protein [Heliobacterium chlorum]
MIYNVRYDRNEQEEVIRRIREESLLSQGWGGGDYDLRVERSDFVERCKNYYGMTSTRIPTNLSRLRDFKDGDLLVVPHLPEHGRVSIFVVDGDFPTCYDYLPNDQTHLNHRIKIKNAFGLDENISVYHSDLTAWYGKLQWMRLPIFPIEQYTSEFEKIIGALTQNPQTDFPASSLEQFLEKEYKRILEELKKSLNLMNPSLSSISFENICKDLLEFNGYTIIGRNKYDGKGGDIDFYCIRKRTSLLLKTVR